ncbi:hypothetical protein AAVH_12605 [Aphelenchoides avenae]|nr:hypothetical protein AAVH_12605 [Aphelenchus avenae]
MTSLAFVVVAVISAFAPVQSMVLRMGHQSHNVQLFVIKLAITECRVPVECRESVQKSLVEEHQVPECAEMEYSTMMDCLDQVILSRTNATDLNARTSRVCCEAIEDVTRTCRVACRSALNSPTLNPDHKLNRIRMLCEGSDAPGDYGVLKCLATTAEWLKEKYALRK